MLLRIWKLELSAGCTIEFGPRDLAEKEIGESASGCVAARYLRDSALLGVFDVKRAFWKRCLDPQKLSDASAYF